MTEMTNIPANLDVPPFHPTAFFAALIAAPILITLLTFWTVISLFALPLGGPAYLIIGTPTLLWAVGRYEPDALTYAVLGLVANIAGAVICLAILTVRNGLEPALEFVLFYFTFGLLYAPLWAGMFGALYKRWNPYCQEVSTEERPQ